MTKTIFPISDSPRDGGDVFYDGSVISLPNVQVNSSVDGGYKKVSWGSLNLTSDTFGDVTVPEIVDIEARWGISTSASTFVFAGSAILRKMEEESISYDLYEEEMDTLLLKQGHGVSNTQVIESISVNGTEMTCTTTQSHGFTELELVSIQPKDDATTIRLKGIYEIKYITDTTFTVDLKEVFYDDCLANYSRKFRLDDRTTFSFDTDHYVISNDLAQRGISVCPLQIERDTSYKLSVSVKDGSASGVQFQLHELFNNTILQSSGIFTTTDTITNFELNFNGSNESNGIYLEILDNLNGEDIQLHSIKLEQTFDSGYVTESAYCGTDILDIPIVIGNIQDSHMIPARTGLGGFVDAIYYRPTFLSTIESGLNVYDDSVDITSSATFVTDSVDNFYLERTDAQFVGQASFTGTGNCMNLRNVFERMCDRLGLNLSVPVGHTPEDISIDHIQYTQTTIIDFLDKIAGYCNYSFYFTENRNLVLINNDVSNGTAEDFDEFNVVNNSYSWDMPIKEFTAEWSTYIPFSIGGFPALKEQKQNISISTSPLGETKAIQIFDINAEKIKEKLNKVKNRLQKPKISVIIPLERLVVMGNEINFKDRFQYQGKVLEGVGIVESIDTNFQDETVTIGARINLSDPVDI